MPIGKWIARSIRRNVARADRFAKSLTGVRIAEITEKAGKIASVLSIVSAAGLWIWEAPDRAQAKHYTAWSLIASSQGKKGEFGRVGALENLNADGVTLDGIILNSAILRHVRLPGASMVRADFAHADLDGENFECTRVQTLTAAWGPIDCAANLLGSSFADANPNGANFTSSNMRDATITNARVMGTKFKSAGMNEVTFSDSQMFCPDFSHAEVFDTKFVNIQFLPCARGTLNGYETSITEIPPNFDGSLFWGVNLQRTNITLDMVRRATLCAVWMPDGTVINSGCGVVRPLKYW